MHGTGYFHHQSLDFNEITRDFPAAQAYAEITHIMSHDEMHALQESRFLQQMRRAWEIPFYQLHWAKAGMEAGDIRSLEDLSRIPPYDVYDLRESIERQPPWGDYMGFDPSKDKPMPLVLQTSGGTTGFPRPMLYSPKDREVMIIMGARRMYMQGVRPFDIVQVTLALGLSNGGMLHRESIINYTGAIPVMTGAGTQTPTRRQIEFMQAWKVNFLAGFPAYVRHIGLVARDEMGIDPRSFQLKGLLLHLGADNRQALEDLWGADAYDYYGTNECGGIAADCKHKAGMHVFEDAFFVEVNDPDTLAPKPPGEKGTLFLTSLFKHLAPVIRFNVNDVSAFGSGNCACGSPRKRLLAIYGRSDNMIKLRGVNIFPEAIGSIVSRNNHFNGEYVCIVDRNDSTGRDEMTVLVETVVPGVDTGVPERELADRLKEALGVKFIVQAAVPGEIGAMTGLGGSDKVKRVIDRRKSS